MAVIYTDDEQRLVQAARDLASTVSEEIQVETYENELRESIELNMHYAAAIAVRKLKDFIRDRSR